MSEKGPEEGTRWKPMEAATTTKAVDSNVASIIVKTRKAPNFREPICRSNCLQLYRMISPTMACAVFWNTKKLVNKRHQSPCMILYMSGGGGGEGKEVEGLVQREAYLTRRWKIAARCS
jgi:hypothetical protein